MEFRPYPFVKFIGYLSLIIIVVWVFFYFRENQKHDWIIFVLIFGVSMVFILGGLELIVTKITIMNEGIMYKSKYLISTFYSFENMKDCRLNNEGYGIKAIELTLKQPEGKIINIPYSIIQDGEIVFDILQSYSEDAMLPTKDDIIYAEEYKQLYSQAITESEKEKIDSDVKKWKIVLDIFLWVGGIFCCVLLFASKAKEFKKLPIHEISLVLIGLFLLVILLPYFSNGIVKFNTKMQEEIRSPNPTAFPAIVVFGGCLVLCSLYFSYLDTTLIYIITFVAGVIIGLIWAYIEPHEMTYGLKNKFYDRLFIVVTFPLLSAFIGMITIYPLITIPNAVLDSSKPHIVEAKINKKSGGTRYTVFLSFSEKYPDKEFEVTPEKFKSLQKGETVYATIRGGAIGFPWIENIEKKNRLSPMEK